MKQHQHMLNLVASWHVGLLVGLPLRERHARLQQLRPVVYMAAAFKACILTATWPSLKASRFLDPSPAHVALQILPNIRPGFIELARSIEVVADGAAAAAATGGAGAALSDGEPAGGSSMTHVPALDNGAAPSDGGANMMDAPAPDSGPAAGSGAAAAAAAADADADADAALEGDVVRLLGSQDAGAESDADSDAGSDGGGGGGAGKGAAVADGNADGGAEAMAAAPAEQVAAAEGEQDAVAKV